MECRHRTNYTESSLVKENFLQKESRWFAYLRQNETSGELRGSAYGIGGIVSSASNVINFDEVTEAISVGDELYQVNGSNQQLIGVVESYTAKSITVVSIEKTIVDGLFAYCKKNSRIEGGEIRGYYAEVTLSDSSNTNNALFAVNTNAVPSFVSV